MPIDPSIALSVKPAQFEDPINMMGRYAQLQQAQSANQLNALKMDEYQRGVQQQNALRSALTGVDINTPEGRTARDQAYVNQGMLDKLQEVKKSEAEVENLLSKSSEAKTDNITKRMALSKIRLEGVKTPQDYLAWHEENHTDPVLDDYYKSLGVKKDDALAKIQASSQNPTAFQQMLLESKVGVTNALKNHILSQDTGQTTRLLSTPEYGPGAATVVPGSTVTKTLSPEAAAANARALASQVLARDRFNYEKEQAKAGEKPPAGYRWNADKSALEVIPGGPAANKAESLTEGERKAATLLTRLRGSSEQLNKAVEGSPGSTKPGVLAESARAVLGDTPANLLTGQARQRVEAAQLDMLDAALTLGTGAAYTKEQLRGYAKSYFPQIGDDPETIEDKKQRLSTLIQSAEISAGRAGAQVPKSPGAKSGGTWSVVK